jgi:hypothetical protein
MTRNLKSIFSWMILSFILIWSVQSASAAALPSGNLQQGTWSNPVSLTPQQSNTWFPDIIADTTGRLHVVFAGGMVGYDAVLYSTSMDGRDWSVMNDIAVIAQKNDNYSDATRPSLLITQDGYLNLNFGTSNAYFSRSPALTANLATSWSQPVKLNGTNSPYFSKTIEDNQGVFHMILTENQPSSFCTSCYHLFYRSSKNQGQDWSEPVDISKDNIGSAKPQMITDQKGNFFAVWESGTGGALGNVQNPSIVMFAASYDNGLTWDEAVQLAPNSFDASRNIAIQMDKKGALVVAWLGLPDNKVFYQVSSDLGKNWSNPHPISEVGGAWDQYPSQLDDYSMAVDGSGNIHLVLVGMKVPPEATPEPGVTPTPLPTPTPIPQINAKIQLSILHLTWNGDTWSQPEEVVKYKGNVPEWPRVAVSLGNTLNMVWFVRDEKNVWNTDKGHYRIWYSRKELSIPAVPTVVKVFPTQASSTPVVKAATTDSSATMVASPTVVPTLQDTILQNQLYYTEKDYLKVVGIALIPVILIIMVIGGIILRRR